MTRRDLDAFVGAITGDTAAAGSILTRYADLLAGRLGSFLGALQAPERDVVAHALDTADALPGGALSAIIWPPVAAHLLGRRAVQPSVEQFTAELRAGAALALDAEAQVAEFAPWLAEQVNGGKAWTAGPTSPVQPGWQRLERCAPDVASVTRAATRVIVERAAADVRTTGSWSTDELIGCTVLINAKQRPDPEWLAECLLHEAVHHWQGMVEASSPFIRDPALVQRSDRFRSPWTGSALTAKSLLAACFVWYALAEFWARANAPAMTWRAARGFVEGDPEALITAFADALDPDVPRVIADLQARVRSR